MFSPSIKNTLNRNKVNKLHMQISAQNHQNHVLSTFSNYARNLFLRITVPSDFLSELFWCLKIQGNGSYPAIFQ